MNIVAQKSFKPMTRLNLVLNARFQQSMEVNVMTNVSKTTTNPTTSVQLTPMRKNSRDHWEYVAILVQNMLV